ncbi:MAG: biotin--[acetyl-CoA-carboxylase] ligase [Myxococcota bacterium]
MSAGPLRPLEEERRSCRLGTRIFWREECLSTQLEAHALAAAGAAHGTLVVARRQSAGRGRAGRSWHSAGGGLYLSLLLRPDLPAARYASLTLLVGAGVLEALCELGIDAHAKWPNDLLLRRQPAGPLGAWRKVAGILVEGVTGPRGLEGAVVGIGLNVSPPPGGFPAELIDLAAALTEERPELDEHMVLRQLLTTLEDRLAFPAEEKTLATALDVLRRRSATLGHMVRANDEGVSGLAVDFDTDGALLVQQPSGERVRVVAGDVLPLP